MPSQTHQEARHEARRVFAHQCRCLAYALTALVLAVVNAVIH